MISIDKLLIELKKTITTQQFAMRTVLIIDNARIHKTNELRQYFKEKELKVFSLPEYSPELNDIEHTFGTLKYKLSRCNLNSKDFLYNITSQIQTL